MHCDLANLDNHLWYFGWDDFLEDGKREVENKREDEWGGGGFGWKGIGKGKLVGLTVISPGPPKLDLPKSCI